MIRGLWISAAALSPTTRAQEILANNLANAGTGGFRQDRVAFERVVQAAGAASGATGAAAPAGAPGALGVSGVEEGLGAAPRLITRLDPGPGPLETTDSPYHLAVAGPGYFAVQGPDGELYTRDGTLQLAPDGTLLHRSGYPLLTEGGALTVPPGGDFTVASDGTVSVNGESRGKLRVVALPDPSSLSHAGTGLLRSAIPGEADATSRVIQGSLEGANVDPVLAMVDMVTLLRGFEANQRAIIAQDGTLGRLVQWANG
jgi:flagellar basal-body rod protein FlgF